MPHTSVSPMTSILENLDPEARGDHENVLIALRNQREARVGMRKAIVDGAKAEYRDDLLASEDREFKRIGAELSQVDDLINATIDKMEERAQRNRANAPYLSGGRVSGGHAPGTYGPASGESYFRDLVLSKRDNDPDAVDRLRRHANEVRVDAGELVRQGKTEFRDLSRVDTAGGYFTPPMHMVAAFAAKARASRVTADLLNRQPLPGGTDSINIPRVTTGVAVAVQASDNAAVQETDLVDAVVTAPVITIAGQSDVAVQLLEQSPIAFDQVIFEDLSAAYAAALDVQVLSGTAASGQMQGLRGTAGIISVVYTDATPTVGEIYPKLADALSQMATARFLPPEAWVMHPRRFSWILAALDTSGRPLVVPSGSGGTFNSIAGVGPTTAQGAAGVLLGLPVFLDANVPTNLGGGTEDVILALRGSDTYLFESSIRTRVLPDVGSGTLTTRLQLYAFAAIAARYPSSIATVGGTGCIAPTF